MFPEDLQSAAKLATKLSFEAQLAAFIRLSRAIMKQIGTSNTLDLLKPASFQGNKLFQYGIKQHVPCISATLCLSQAAASTMHLQLLTLMGQTSVCPGRGAKQRIKVGKLRIARQPPWSSMALNKTLTTIAAANIQRQADAFLEDPCNSASPKPSQDHLKCPRCRAQRD